MPKWMSEAELNKVIGDLAKNEGETDQAFYERQIQHIKEIRGWPDNVTLAGSRIGLLGVDEATGQLFWDGQPIVTKHELGRREFFLAFVAAWSTFGAAVIGLAALILQFVK